MCDVLTFNPYIHYEMTRVKLFNLSVPVSLLREHVWELFHERCKEVRLLGQKRMWIFNITNLTKILSKLPHIFLSTSYQHSLKVPVSLTLQPTLNKFCTFLFCQFNGHINLASQEFKSFSSWKPDLIPTFSLKSPVNCPVKHFSFLSVPSSLFIHSTNICWAFIICSSQCR